ncbi:hypothetical protein J4760_04000 [Salinicoccus sp. ID82-1]|uniref:hypothetical protein n=1 Tax=Salinicoccus sp. ID82-1 TaxID=2820269 RepID=UPI001F391F79|nr:hypothetical protein [Salinicoccus sp. ID82-1]MCG1009214.1 hypothetical protein [Salinicoccus sp. ID82-1]
MMRKPKWNELGLMLFSLYMWFTLTVEPALFFDGGTAKADSVYATYIAMVGSQRNLAWISITVATLFFLILFTRRFAVLITIHIMGLAYYFFITASFLLNYPNIAFGIMSLVSVALFKEILDLIDVSEDLKKDKILNEPTKGGE